MEIFKSAKKLQSHCESLRLGGKRISFVPTMGYLHEGHLNLMREGKKFGDYLIISIFVNPAQFGPHEDLEKYPRDFVRDEKLASTAGVDAIFYPENEEMYPPNYQTYVTVEKVTQNLCGQSRPIHFRGVATICAKLFNIVKPHTAIFGKKDFQQLVTIQRMVNDLNMDLAVVGIDTTREDDGLAMSSRNAYLKKDERESALSLSRSLIKGKEMYDAGERNAGVIIKKLTEFIASHTSTKIDYVKICDTENLEDIDILSNKSVLALAVWVGSTRLIDNYVFGEPLNIK
ncbi:MAG: pantoate--beta-alanine ligase [Syntrophales bacterium]|jgi:pantoate--beta-alanine ligase|nr:pantoate--beta-alanine ligase [Syntrophales bacterium]MDY0045134.1 pantoate--beta-alanine ligase [Syntrophales bacterium]